MVVVSKTLGMGVVMEGVNQTLVMVVMEVVISSKVVMVVVTNNKVAMVVVVLVVNNRVAMMEAMVVSNRALVAVQVMTHNHNLKDMVHSHLLLIPTIKAMILSQGLHKQEAMVLPLHLAMVVEQVPIKDIRVKVRDMINHNHLHLHILLEVARTDRLHLSNMEANLHMALEQLVDKIKATTHSPLHSTLKDRAILRLHRVMEIRLQGIDEQLY